MPRCRRDGVTGDATRDDAARHGDDGRGPPPGRGALPRRVAPYGWTAPRARPHTVLGYAARRGGSRTAGVGVAPPALEGQAPRPRRDELVDLVGAPRAWVVRAHDGRVVEQRLADLPEALDAVGRGEQGPVA